MIGAALADQTIKLLNGLLINYKMELPQQINLINASGWKLVRFALAFFGTWIVSSFLFEADFPYHVLAAIGTIVLGISLIVVFVKMDQRKKTTIVLSEEGILEHRVHKETFISWHEMHQTYYDATTFTKIGLPLATVTKTQVIAPNRRIFVNYPLQDFHNTLIDLSQKHLLPILLNDLNQGKRVYFGPVEMSKDMVHIKNETIPISEISSFKVDNGILKLKFKGDWFSTKIPVNDIPNILCLLTILEMK